MIGDRTANTANDRRALCWTLDDVIVNTVLPQRYTVTSPSMFGLTITHELHSHFEKNPLSDLLYKR